MVYFCAADYEWYLRKELRFYLKQPFIGSFGLAVHMWKTVMLTTTTNSLNFLNFIDFFLTNLISVDHAPKVSMIFLSIINTDLA